MNGHKKKIAVITRTKDRGLMLRRAMDSVMAQTCNDFVWVVVNDGGNRAEVEDILSDDTLAAIDLIKIHHETSKGMEAASNAGIQACDSDFIVIHDDDDTWEPEFLSQCVELLESPFGQNFVGVITETNKIEETIENREIKILARSRWKPQIGGYPVGCVQISDMAVENLFAPIAFLYRRALYKAIGGYDEGLPVLGDWDFNLKALINGDIAVLSEPLANYHHRPAIKHGTFGNSLQDGLNKHVIYDAVIRNRIIREASISDGAKVMATLMISGRHRLTSRHFHKAKKAMSLAKSYVRKFAYRFKIIS